MTLRENIVGRVDFGSIGTACMNVQDYGKPTDLGADPIILYHGTRAPLEKILREGLLIRAGLVGDDTRLMMVDNALDVFGYTRANVPEWVWKGEWNYERTKPPHLHMSVSVGTASAYAWTGCEIQHEIWTRMISLMTQRILGLEEMYDKELFEALGERPRDIARLMNGKESHVFCVEVPRTFVYPEDLERTIELFRKRFEELGRSKEEIDNYLSKSTVEVRVIKHIPPSMFRKIWRVPSSPWLVNPDKGWECNLEEVTF